MLGLLKIINFPFGTNGKLMVLGAPIFKHFRALQSQLEKKIIVKIMLISPKMEQFGSTT